jgi:hypothetical protein
MKILAAVCSIILVPTYVYVAYAIFNVKASQEYIDYYISKSTTLTVRQQNELKDPGNFLPIEFGKIYPHGDNKHFVFDGWSYAEENHRWSERKQARMLFYLIDSGVQSGLCAIKILGVPHGDQELKISINRGREIKYVLTQEQEIVFGVNSFDMRDGLNEITFSIPDARRPGNGDPRTLGLAIKSIKIECPFGKLPELPG